ncbi:hypothetical protein LAZ67_16000265 [Cordylochernes scorpioides]|uniref:Uncharacterized protein n=1 Tax=Cordylochernes scorpioides TaxID=51811 RepID=A0ABY6LAG4_9ARAC|nr:hypothetical protein LAZ67_16000265 [Cordylochernes scorpioides]
MCVCAGQACAWERHLCSPRHPQEEIQNPTKQRLTYFRPIMRADGLEKMLGKFEGRPAMSWLEGIKKAIGRSLDKLTIGKVRCLSSNNLRSMEFLYSLYNGIRNNNNLLTLAGLAVAMWCCISLRQLGKMM